jgi:uncharacterized DUF497 family protein
MGIDESINGLLTVAHTVRGKNEGTPIDIFRIISARATTGQERRRYENENGSLHS